VPLQVGIEKLYLKDMPNSLDEKVKNYEGNDFYKIEKLKKFLLKILIKNI
jgi:hypothetical protein